MPAIARDRGANCIAWSSSRRASLPCEHKDKLVCFTDTVATGWEMHWRAGACPCETCEFVQVIVFEVRGADRRVAYNNLIGPAVWVGAIVRAAIGIAYHIRDRTAEEVHE